MNWKNLVLALAAVIATFIFPLLSPLNPPFDEAGFVAIVTWIVGILLGALGGYVAKKLLVTARSKGFGDAIIKQLIGLILTAILAIVWPFLSKLSPPFDAALFGDIINWFLCLIASVIFGWNVKALKSH